MIFNIHIDSNRLHNKHEVKRWKEGKGMIRKEGFPLTILN